MAKMIQSTVQSLLNFRERIEDERAIVLKNTKASLVSEEEKLEEIERKKSLLLSLTENIENDDLILSVNQLQVSTDYQTQLNALIVNQKDEVEKVLQKVVKDREDLIDAAKDKKAVENLRDRRLAEYLKAKRRKEERDESEIAIRSFAGKTRILE